jgi:hypothetical protein
MPSFLEMLDKIRSYLKNLNVKYKVWTLNMGLQNLLKGQIQKPKTSCENQMI